MARKIAVNPLTEHGFFAEILGADLGDCSDDAQFAAIKAAHLAHGVIVIRDQTLTPGQQIAYSRRFGPLAIHVLEDQLLEGHPEILLVSNKTRDGKYVGLPDAGRYWHTDQSYEQRPALGSLLYALEVPADGSGDTLFCDMAAAYEALPAAMKGRLEGLRGMHIYNHNHKAFSLSDDQKGRLPGFDHPIVRTHPETGRKALYLGGKILKHIIGLPADESAALLNELYGHCQSDAFVYRHKWRAGDVVFWDNRCTMHFAQPYDDATYTRHMHRTT
ncbi:MAG: TauD/TfdA family dioxygenase, partial [Pseudomonadota bacterium]